MFVVALPAGMASWTRIALSKSETYDQVDENIDYFVDYSASWSGSIDPLLPSDYEVQASLYEYHDAIVEYRWYWYHDKMNLYIGDYDMDFNMEVDLALSLNGNSVELRYRDFTDLDCWINGECVGLLGPDWEIIGPCEE